MASTTVTQLFDLAGRTALVTGGSRGLGLQLARGLGEAGARVLLAARKAGELEAAANTLRADGIEADWLAADCADEDELRRLGATALERLGGVDILVNNAGAAWGAPAEEHPLAAWDKVFDLNIRGYFILSQYLARHDMIPKGRGSIINVASIGGLGGNPVELRTIAYNSSKGAVLNYTRALAAEWGCHGIRVNAICPGFFPSRLSQGAMAAQGGAEALAARVPLRRLGGESDLKGIAVLYASDAGRHITGQWLAVDGGSSVVISG